MAKVKFIKPYEGPLPKEIAEGYKDYFIEVSKKPYLEIERGNSDIGYHTEKVKNDFKGAFIRRRARSQLYDVFVKLENYK